MRWFERQRALMDFTLSSLMRRKGRNLSLLLVYTLMVFLVSSVIFFADAIHREAGAILEDSPEMIVQRVVGGRHDLIPLSYAEKIGEIRGALSVKPRLWGYYYHQASRTNYTLMAPEDFPYSEDSVKIGKGVLRTWGTVRGTDLYFRSYTGEHLILKIAETFEAGTDLVSSDLILMAENTFRRIAGVPEGFATDFAVRIRNENEAQTIAEKILTVLPDTRPILKTEIIRTYSSLFDWRSGYIIVLLSGAFMAFFIFAWDKATGLSAEEKTETGILKGLGWDTSDILTMKFWEGGIISLTAFLIGVAAAFVHVFFASATLFEHALKGWSILYPEFDLIPSVNPYQLSVLFFLTVVPYTFITIVPTWRVSVMDPDAVMRH
ncbi:MAG: FtsX-like permease family protein [Desulfobacteraceae bacterium]|nr:MAG: FtsX-like permease family protein [Desulfobacteraceae bacterium]